MEERNRKNSGFFGMEEMNRRAFLKTVGAAGGILTISGFPWGDVLAQTKIEVEDPAYNKIYNSHKGFYMQDPKWVEQTLPRLQWTKAGERVPVLEVLHTPVDFPFWTDFMRKVSSDAQQLGLKYELRAVSRARRLDDGGENAGLAHGQHGDDAAQRWRRQYAVDLIREDFVEFSRLTAASANWPRRSRA